MKYVFLLFVFVSGIAVFGQDCGPTGPCTFDGEKWCGECPNAVISAVPFLRITPDARSGGMGDAGISSSPDANSLHANASRLAWAEDNFSISASYVPWLRGLVKDVYLAYIGGYKNIDNLQTVGFSLRYFSLGDIQFTDQNGEPLGNGRPNEFDISLAYAKKLSDKFAVAVTGRYIYSNLAGGQTVDNVEINPAHAGAVDITMTYKTKVKSNQDLTLGLAITNLGSKVTYTESQYKDFLPGNLGFGVGWSIDFDDYNRLTLTGELNKLLVPTPIDPTDPEFDQNNNGVGDYREQSVMEGVINSFSDAPGRFKFKEEMREINYILGVEYWYDEQFSVRTGYFHEHGLKGNRKFFTLGLGLKYNIFGLDMSYLIPANGQRSPLDNTLRFTLMFNFEKFSDLGNEFN